MFFNLNFSVTNKSSTANNDESANIAFRPWPWVLGLFFIVLSGGLVWLTYQYLEASLSHWASVRSQALYSDHHLGLKAAIEEGLVFTHERLELLSRFTISAIVLFSLLLTVWVQQKIRIYRIGATSARTEKSKVVCPDDGPTADELRSQISHELRTPIASVVSCLEAAMTDSRHRSHPAVKRAYGAANDMLEMLNKTLDASRLANDRLIFQIDEFSLRNLLSKSVESVDIAAQRKNIELILDVTPDMPDLLFGDALRLRQILVNLLSNAIKFTDKGEVRLAVKQLPLKDNKVELTFCVQDTGRGMSPKQSKGLFAPYVQAEGQSSARYGGSGLGLYITRQLVVGMGGQIQVHSQKSVGSTFLISLPLQLCQHGKTPVPQIQPNSGLLIISHNLAQRRVLKAQLQGFFEETHDSDPALKMDLSWIHGLKKIYVLLNLDSLYPSREGLLNKLNMLRDNHSDVTLLTLVNGFLKPQQVKDLEYLSCSQVISKPALPIAVLEAMERVSYDHELEVHVPEVNQLLKGLRILLAEDEVTLREITSETLHDWGAEVEVVSNGAEAVASILHSSEKFDLVLMDLAMPYLNGTEATRQIREVYDRDALPIIALTSYNTEEQIQSCLESGVNVHQVKPVNFLALARLILRLCKVNEPVNLPDNKSLRDLLSEQETFSDSESLLLDYSKTLFRGNRDLYCKALERFYMEYLNSRFSQSLKADGLDRQRLHQLRGASALIGAQKLSALCSYFEKNWNQLKPLDRQNNCSELCEVLSITGELIKTKMHKEVNK